MNDTSTSFTNVLKTLDQGRKEYWNERDSNWDYHHKFLFWGKLVTDIAVTASSVGALGAIIQKKPFTPMQGISIGGLAFATSIIQFFSQKDYLSKANECHAVAHDFDRLRRNVSHVSRRTALKD